MKAFWKEMFGRVIELSRLDANYSLSHGARAHKYRVGPVVSNRIIRKFEKRNDINLPSNYRSYLQYFGNGGAGPGLGIVNFPDDTWQGDLTKPLDLDHLNLEVTQGFIEIDESETQVYDRDGMLAVGRIGEAENYLVVTGPLQGYVLCWIEGQGMLGVRGPFDQWYKNWVDRMIYGFHEIAVLKTIKVGMHLSEVEALPYVEVEDRYKNGFLYFIHLNWSIKLDGENKVEKLNFDDVPLF